MTDNRLNDDFYDLLEEEEEDYNNGFNQAGYGALKSNGGEYSIYYIHTICLFWILDFHLKTLSLKV